MLKKNDEFGPKSSFLAISGSGLKWVENWSNWVEYYISHSGWSVEVFKTPWKSPWGPPLEALQEASKMMIFCPKSSFLAIHGSGRFKWVEHWSNLVEYYISHFLPNFGAPRDI